MSVGFGYGLDMSTNVQESAAQYREGDDAKVFVISKSSVVDYQSAFFTIRSSWRAEEGDMVGHRGFTNNMGREA